MALISAFTLIRALSLFHLTLAYFFLTAPGKVTDQNAVYVLGQAIRLPHVTSLTKPNETSAFAAVILAFLGFADLTAASLEERISIEYWQSNVPVRLIFLFGLTAYIYTCKDDGIFGSTSLLQQETPGELLRNSLVFAWAFMETSLWFWVFLSLRDERREILRKQAQRLQAEEDRL